MHGTHEIFRENRGPRIFMLGGEPLARAVVQSAGCEIVAWHSLPSSTADATGEDVGLDCAVVELVLANGTSDDIIRRLQDSDIPVIICTSLMRNAVAGLYPGAVILSNPYSSEELRDAIVEAVGRRTS